MADEERDWFKDHPEAQADPQNFETSSDLTLWNFPVGGADLARAHDDAIRRFAGRAYVASSKNYSAVDFVVRGHASATGEDKFNTDLALKRAQNVDAVLKRLGFLEVGIESAGSREPAESGSLGQTLARNRRVKVTRVMKPVQVTPESPKPATPESPKPATPESPTPTPEERQFGVALLNLKINVLLREVRTPVVIEGRMIGEVKLMVAGNKDLVAARVVKHVGGQPALTGDFEKKLGADLKKKLLGAESDEQLQSIGVGAEAGHWFRSPTITYQDRPNFVYIDFKPVDKQELVVEFPETSAEVHMVFTGNLRFDVGPSGTSLSGAVPSALPKDPLMIARTVRDAIGQEPQLDKEEIRRLIDNLASRDGAASKVALEVLEPEGKAAFEARRVEWMALSDDAVDRAWLKGSVEVDWFLRPAGTPPQVEAKHVADHKAKWKAEYGDGPGGKEFKAVRERVFTGLKGYDDNQGDLKGLIGGL